MAPTSTVTVLYPTSRSETLLDSEKKIWVIVVPLSIGIPCLVALALYLVRRHREKKAEREPRVEGVPIEVHHQAWLEQMRNMNQQNQELVFVPDDARNAANDAHWHGTTQHARSQSTPPTLQAHSTPQRIESPLRRECRQPDGICDKDIFEFPPPQQLHPYLRRESAY